ncbi:MAG: hypothetical protein RLZ13_703 [Bacteroidota bacterium]
MSKQGVALLLFLGLFCHTSFSQTYRFTAGVTEPGVYKLSADQARKLGFGSLEEVALYGYPGMLPQVLDSAQLHPQEIPTWLEDNQLFFYLAGPHNSEFTEAGELTYSHHLYTDTLRYVLGKKSSPKRIEARNGTATNPSNLVIWYQLLSVKEEKINLLNSGRSWYSLPIRQGQSLTINFGKNAGNTSPWLLHSRLMSQSTGPSSMRVWTDAELVEEVIFSPISNSTYAVKGHEVQISKTFAPKGDRLDQLRFSFQGTGSGHLDVALVGIPFTNSSIKEGLFFGKEENQISLETGLQTWEISNFYEPIRYTQGKSAMGEKWVLFSPKNAKELGNIKAVVPKSTKPSSIEMLVITVPQLKQVAQQFQEFKASQGISTQVVLTSEIYDWMGYGNPDLSAIRNYIAQEYHQGKQLKNVLLLGKGTFDYKKKLGGRPNLVPIYTSRSSLDPLTTYSSDDYFGILDWGSGEWEESIAGDALLQIGVGRVPAITFAEAKSWLEKSSSYEKQGEAFPSRTITFLADDGDNGVHMRDSEVHAAYLEKNLPFYRSQKLYLDRFEQTKSGGRQESPTAKNAILESLNSGTLLLNYVGHGNETTLSAEEIFKVQDLGNWPNQAQLPLWFTATCEFGRHDSPFIRSAAEELLFADSKGAIGLLATGRPVFSSVNFTINEAFIQALAAAGKLGTADLGTLYRQTKNESLNGAYNRNFSLLGDPSLRLALPDASVRIDKLVALNNQTAVDTLRNLVPIKLTAEVIDPLTQGFLSSVQGSFKLEIWGQATKSKTLGDENAAFEFSEENQRLFSGEGEVRNGKIESQFILPEGLENSREKIQIRIQAWDKEKKLQAAGTVFIPLLNQKKGDLDQNGPQITAEIDGQGIATAPPISSTQVRVILNFRDPSGTNSSTLFPDKIMQLRINQGPPQQIYQAYRALEGSFEKGTAQVVLKELKEGKNTIEVLAWDNFGNLGTYSFSIEVQNSEQLQVISHQIYPNPATANASIRFRHNRPQETLLATWTVFSPLGQVLFSEERRLLKDTEELTDWNWIFFQTKTKYPAKGTYIYKLTLQSESSLEMDSVSGKLVIQ